MSRLRKGRSYGHRVHKWGLDSYTISWTVDFYYRNSRLRWPRGFRRNTDLKGAQRFAKKWDVRIEL